MKVRAKSLGYYNHKRQYEGAEFFLKNAEKDFSEKWMEVIEVEAKAPKKKARSKKVSEETEQDSNSEVI